MNELINENHKLNKKLLNKLLMKSIYNIFINFTFFYNLFQPTTFPNPYKLFRGLSPLPNMIYNFFILL